MEIDFLLARSRTERRHNISPIEVKSGMRYSTVSLDKFRTKYKRFLDVPYVLHPKDLKVEDGVTYLVPENDAMQPIEIRGTKREKLMIQGVATMVIKEL